MAALQIARTVALPGKHQPLRLPNFPALERTAVLGFNSSLPVSVFTGETRVMLTRQAYYPLWLDYLANSSVPAAYGVSWTTSIISEYAATYSASATVMGNHVARTFGNAAVSGFLTPAIAGTSALQPYINFSYPILGVDAATGPQEWIYVPQGSWLMCTVIRSTTSTVLTAVVTVEIWQRPGDVAEYITNAFTVNIGANKGGSATPAKFNIGAWVRPVKVNVASDADPVAHDFTVYMGVGMSDGAPVYTPSTVNAGGWAFSGVNTGRMFLPAAVTPEYENSTIPWSGTRVTAVSALFTNTTKVLNKEGTVLWGRLNPAATDVWNSKGFNLTSLHPAEKAYMDLEQGTYTYCPPSTDLADFRSYYIVPETTLSPCPVYRLDNAAMVNFGAFTDPDGGTNLALNLDWHIEFRSSSTLFNLGVSSLTLEALHAAQIGLLKAGFFYHNFDHVMVLNGIIKAIGSLNPFLKMAAPLAKGLLGSSSVAISNRPGRNNRPTPTSGARSGIVSERRQTRKRRPPPRLPPRTRPRVTRSRTQVSRANAAMDRIIARQGRPATLVR